MPRYEVQFKTSRIVAYSATVRALCEHWIECNNFAPDTDYYDPITGEIVPERVTKGECLNLFILKKIC